MEKIRVHNFWLILQKDGSFNRVNYNLIRVVIRIFETKYEYKKYKMNKTEFIIEETNLKSLNFYGKVSN